MTECIQGVFWLTSTDYQQWFYVSPAFETLWGHSLEQLYNYPGGHLNLIVDSIDLRDRERVVTMLTQQPQGESLQEYRIVRSDGSIRWVRSHSFVIPASLGETERLATLCEDITACKQRQELLYQGEQECRVLVEYSPDLIFRFDRNLRHLYVNPIVELATGISHQEFIGKTHGELSISEELASFWQQSLQKVFQTGQSEEMEFTFVTPQGLRYYQSRLVPEFTSDGSVTSILGVTRDITTTKQTQEALRESEERFRTVFESVWVGMAIVNRQGQIIQSNQALQDILGYTEAELQAMPGLEFANPEDQAESNKLLEELLAGQRTQFSQEKPYLHKEGHLVWCLVSARVIWDSQGLPSYVIALIQDISERKQAELELQQAQEQLEQRVLERTAELTQANRRLEQEIAERQLLAEQLQAQKEFLQNIIDTNPNLIYVKDREDKYVLTNQVFADCCGLTVVELLGKTTADLHSNLTDVERYIAEDQQVIATLEPKCIPEEVYHTSNGEVRWYQTIKTPLVSRDGQVIYVLGVSTDITDRKLAEEQLREREAQLRLAVDAARMGTWNWNLQTGKITWSSRLEQLYGFAANTYDGTYKTFIARVHPQDRDRVRQSYLCALDKEENSDFEFRIVRFDGSIRWIESKSQVFYDETGQPVGMIGINVDVSDRKQAEMQIQASLREKEVLLQEIHHRVKNNLQIISSLLDLQAQHIEEPATLELFRETQNRVKSMALVHEKLYQSQDFDSINFFEYIQNLTSYLFQVYTLEAGKVTLELDIDEVNLSIDTAIPCGLIISELVSNALKYAFPNSREGIIRVILRADNNNYYTIGIKDNGIGFPPDLDLKSCKSLGLQLVTLLTEQLDGTLELDRSRGTEFTIGFFQFSS